MKKTALLIAALIIPASSAFAYYGSYHDDGMSGFAVFMLLLGIAYMVLIIAVIVKFFKMASDVAQIRQRLTNTSNSAKLTYLVAIGEKEQAQKAAVKILVDKLYPIYFDQFVEAKAATMNEAISPLIPKMKGLGLELPDYLLSGENFIDYINRITGNNVPYAVDDDTATRLFRQ